MIILNFKKIVVCALAGVGAYYLISNYDAIIDNGKEMCKKVVKKLDNKMEEV